MYLFVMTVLRVFHYTPVYLCSNLTEAHTVLAVIQHFLSQHQILALAFMNVTVANS